MVVDLPEPLGQAKHLSLPNLKVQAIDSACLRTIPEILKDLGQADGLYHHFFFLLFSHGWFFLCGV